MKNKEFFEALRLMEKEKGVPAQSLAEKIENAIVVAERREYDGLDIVTCKIDVEKEKIDVYVTKEVVESIDPERPEAEQILLDEALLHSKRAQVGKEVKIKLNPKNFGRIIAQTAKHVIRQGIREAEHGLLLQEFQSKHSEVESATVMSVDPITGNATITVGKSEAILPRGEQIPGEVLEEGQIIKIYIVDVKETEKGPKIMISRTHPGFVKRLFETEVPEILDGIVEIKAVSREAGMRTKMAVYSKDENVDPIGACIGPKGQRVASVVSNLNGEKIDIVKYSEDVSAFISEALSPASVVSVEIVDEAQKSCRASVPDHQLSLAIGNKGQNARLAAKLTGWKIDVKPYSSLVATQNEEVEEVVEEEVAQPDFENVFDEDLGDLE